MRATGRDLANAARSASDPQAILAEPIAAIRLGLKAQAAAGPRAIGRILVVDDNASTLDLLSRRLRRDGHEVTSCDNGEGALELLAGSTYDLVLLDLLMPGLSGVDVLSRIKSSAETALLPVIIVSALDEIDSAVHCIEAGADDYLTKPINPVLLRARMTASLDRKFLRDRDQATTQKLRTEQQRSESLLRNVLPRSVLERFRKGESVIADHFASATILFSDIVDFTQGTARLPPDVVLQLLNDIFLPIRPPHVRTWPGEDQDDRRCLYGGRRPARDPRRPCRRGSRDGVAHAGRGGGGGPRLRPRPQDPHRTAYRARGGRDHRQEQVHLRHLGRYGEHREPHGSAWRAGPRPRHGRDPGGARRALRCRSAGSDRGSRAGASCRPIS